MAQGDVHLDGDGKVSLDAAGKVRLHDAGDTCLECCNPCATGYPPLEVTVSWGANPTSHSTWNGGASTVTLFGQTFTDGQTRNICPTSYTFAKTTGTISSTAAIWRFDPTPTASPSIINFADGRQGTPSSNYAPAAEMVLTKDGAKRKVSANVVSIGGTPSAGYVLGDSSVDISTTSNISTTQILAAAGAPFNFGHVGGQLTTTSDGITISWQKSGFFPAGNVV